jgi:GntR family transcriptional repressor for pyruvate dehydrogenase complex
VSDTRPRFGPVERRTLAEAIRGQITQQILEGALPAGARLPSERELCDEFNVARTSVREAIQGLITLGLVERRGNRAFVSEELPSVDSDVFRARRVRVQELFEVRRLIELPMIELVACRATNDERAEILALADRFEPDMVLDEFRRLDRAFHWALARASHNTLLAEVYGKVLSALFDSEEWASMLSEATAAALREIIESSGWEHREIAARVSDGDAVASLESMAQHLDTVESKIASQLS